MKKWLMIMMTAAVLASAGCSSNSTGTPSSTKQQEAVITKAAFDKIETGATYEDVQKIVGGAGQKISETGKQGEPDYTETYQYKGDKPNSNAKFTFRDKKLSSKSQSMLD